jgi:succinyl-CoA synthetase alpha subunit
VITIPLEYVNDAVIPGSVGLVSRINGKFANSSQSEQFGVGVGVGVGGDLLG